MHDGLEKVFAKVKINSLLILRYNSLSNIDTLALLVAKISLLISSMDRTYTVIYF